MQRSSFSGVVKFWVALPVWAVFFTLSANAAAADWLDVEVRRLASDETFNLRHVIGDGPALTSSRLRPSSSRCKLTSSPRPWLHD